MLALAVGCRNGSTADPNPVAKERTPAPIASSVQAAQFDAMMTKWPERWARIQPPTDCASILGSAERGPCDQSLRALEAMKTASREQTGGDVPLVRAADLALAAFRATETLRSKGLGSLLGDSAAAPTPSVEPSGRAAVASARPPSPAPSARTLGSAHAHDHDLPDRKHDNPALEAIVTQSRLTSLALRQLATYLEHGPLEVRRRALIELSRLSQEEPRWAGLRDLAKEARLTESDPTLRAGLDEVIARVEKARRPR